MSFMTQNKAQEIFDLYMQAELNGEDEKAIAYEKQLNDAKWFIVSDGKGALTIDKQGGLFSTFANTDTTQMLPRNSSTAPYRGTSDSTTSRTGMWIAITLGSLLVIGIVIYVVRAYNKKKANVKPPKKLPK